LFGVGVGCLGYVAGVELGSTWIRWRGDRLFSDRVGSAPAGRAAPLADSLGPGEVVGRLRIDRIGMTAIVLEGADRGTLRFAAGHLPSSPLPGIPGRVALAGHRDGSFRPLKDLRQGDHIVLETPWGDFHYAVDSLRIVAPTDIEILASAGKRELLLLTCYPFSYLGRAPERFAALATQIDLPAVRPEALAVRTITR
jgi:sortase A